MSRLDLCRGPFPNSDCLAYQTVELEGRIGLGKMFATLKTKEQKVRARVACGAYVMVATYNAKDLKLSSR